MTLEVKPYSKKLGEFKIEWNDMVLPLNSELWDKWFQNRREFDHPALEVKFSIMYIPDDEFDKKQREHLKKPSRWKIWKYPKFWWQYYKTRAMTYAGTIYIKQSAHNDAALLLHELGHNLLFLDHTHILRPGIMNPMNFMWLVKKHNRR